MSQHSAYIDRMSERLAALGRNVEEIRQRDSDGGRASDLAAAIEVQRERLNEMRRAGAELTPEMLQSFSASVDRLSTRIGRELQENAA
jgi:hypothetical protein